MNQINDVIKVEVHFLDVSLACILLLDLLRDDVFDLPNCDGRHSSYQSVVNHGEGVEHLVDGGAAWWLRHLFRSADISTLKVCLVLNC